MAAFWLPFFDMGWFNHVTKVIENDPNSEGFFMLQKGFWSGTGELLFKIIERPTRDFWHAAIGINSVVAYEIYAFWIAFAIALTDFKQREFGERLTVFFLTVIYMVFEFGESTGRGEYLFYFLPFFVLIPFMFVRDGIQSGILRQSRNILIYIVALWMGWYFARFNPAPGHRELAILSLFVLAPLTVKYVMGFLWRTAFISLIVFAVIAVKKRIKGSN
jgi:hypothetical protein